MDIETETETPGRPAGQKPGEELMPQLESCPRAEFPLPCGDLNPFS